MRYIIREKFFRLTEDSVIQDEQGAPIYQVKGKIFSLHHTLVLMDLAGNELATVNKQIISPRASGVNVFESRLQEFSAGERVQFLAKDKKLGTHTRDTGTIRSLDEAGNAELILDRNNRVLRFNLGKHPHLDHAYAMTSHSAQSKTVERVLINIDTGDHRLRGLLNEVFSYVAASRPEYDSQIFADDAARLDRVLSRVNEQTKALAPEQIGAYREQLMEVAEPHGSISQMQREETVNHLELALE